MGQFQVSDKIQGVTWDWVEEVVLREAEDQEERAQGDGWATHKEVETAWENERTGVQSRT